MLTNSVWIKILENNLMYLAMLDKFKLEKDQRFYRIRSIFLQF